MVARIVKARLILPQANSLYYKVGATSVNLFWDFTIKLRFFHFLSYYARNLLKNIVTNNVFFRFCT